MDGWTINGKSSRCYQFWKEYCYCASQADRLNESQCHLYKEDYFECLNGSKEVSVLF